MGKVAEDMRIDFVVSTGDNFVDNGPASVDDRAFRESFVDIYTARTLQKPWYLGKHTYSSCLVRWNTNYHLFTLIWTKLPV